MSNPNPHNNQNRETIIRDTDYEREASYRDGYLEAQDVERRYRSDRGDSGVLMGILLATIVGITLGALFFLTQRNEADSRNERPTQILPVPVPNQSQPQSNERKTTVIERTINRTREVVPVPQRPESVPTPNININVPNPIKQETSQSNSSSTQTQSTSSEQDSSNSNLNQ